jgi:hypothetical protein
MQVCCYGPPYTETPVADVSNEAVAICLSPRFMSRIAAVNKYGTGFTLKIAGKINFGSYRSKLTPTSHEAQIELCFSQTGLIAQKNWYVT